MDKKHCEKMLDKEAERVAKSILQLVNSINFNNISGNEESREARNLYNKVAFAIKEVINTEVTKQFLTKHEAEE